MPVATVVMRWLVDGDAVPSVVVVAVVPVVFAVTDVLTVVRAVVLVRELVEGRLTGAFAACVTCGARACRPVAEARSELAVTVGTIFDVVRWAVCGELVVTRTIRCGETR